MTRRALARKPAPVLALYIHSLDPIIVQIGRFGLHWYGLAYVVAFALGYLLYHWLSVHDYNDLMPAEVADFITWAAVFGVMVGGRLGYAIFYRWHETLADPLSIFRVWEGGMASHGGILGLVLYTLYYSWRHKKSWTSMGDSLVVVAPIGLFLVRCANFINGELWGKLTRQDAWWAVVFPTELPAGHPYRDLHAIRTDPAVRRWLVENLDARYPSQLFEAALEGVLLFSVLFVLRTCFRLPRGVLTGCFFILYAAARIVGEVFREPDPAWHWGWFSAGQALSLFMPLIGLAFIVWGLRTQQYEDAFKRSDATPEKAAV